MCKLIRTKSGVLTLALETQYVTEVFERETARPDEKDDKRLRVVLMDAR